MSLNIARVASRVIDSQEAARSHSRVFVWRGTENVCDTLSRGEAQTALTGSGFGDARVMSFRTGTRTCDEPHFVLSDRVKGENNEPVDLHIHLN